MNSTQDNPTKPWADLKTAKLRRPSVKFTLAAAVIAVLIGTGIAASLIPRFGRHNALSAQTRKLSIPTVIVVSPKPGQSTSSLPLSAELKPLAEAPIYARANGYLKRRLVDIGAQVATGQLLAVIDAPELNQDLERTRAQLAQSEAALGLARVTAQRWAVLVKTASVSEQENAEKQADYKLKTASADSARAEMRRLENLESFTRLTAPFAGTITARNVDVGDLIVAGAGKELFHIARANKLRVFVQVPQAMVRGIKIGQTAEMSLPEMSGRLFKPKVVRTAGVMATDSRTLLVELELDNQKGEILAGGYSQVRFPEAKMEATLTLPANTILSRPEGSQVGVVRPDGKVELRTVKLGRDFGHMIEITSGVSPKDRVIMNPSDSLATGTAVVVSQAAEKEKSQ